MKNQLLDGPVQLVALSGVLMGACIAWPTAITTVNALALVAWTLLQIRSLSCLRGTFGKSSTPSTPSTLSLRVQDPVTSNGDLHGTCTSGISCTSASFISVHLPIHNEPARVVKQTLDALSKIDYPAWEVIVVDNNTADESLWRPVQQHCLELGSRFRFMHRMQVKGAKAGALEIARAEMDERTRLIAVVDADYQVEAHFLQLAAAEITKRAVDYIQFPQAYRCSQESQVAVIHELDDYFRRHARKADARSRMLLTGTLSVIDAEALQTTGGWPMRSVTEDAELGLQLREAGYSGSYIPVVAGRGLLPPDIEELNGQRHRWIVGNIHVLIRSCLRAVLHRRPFPCTDHVAQLTAWCSFIGLPLVVLLLAVFLTFANVSGTQHWQAAIAIAVCTIFGQFLVTLCLSRVTPGFASVRWALALSSAVSTLSATMLTRLRFRCTQRDSSSTGSRRPGCWVLTVLLATATWFALDLGWFAVAAALGLCLYGQSLTFWLDGVLRAETGQPPTRPTRLDIHHGQ